MSDDREPIASAKDNKKKKSRDEKPDDTDGGAEGDKKGKCSCNTAFFLSLEGALKVVEFVSIRFYVVM